MGETILYRENNFHELWKMYMTKISHIFIGISFGFIFRNNKPIFIYR